MRGQAGHILAIDDLADRPHDCDLLLDQNLGRAPEDYGGLVPEATRLLIGPQYALLRPEFARARPAALARRAEGGPVRRILVSMGLTDAANATATAIEALAGLPEIASGEIEVRAVLGHAAPHLSTIEAKAAGMVQSGARVSVLVEPPDMAAEMAAADLCVGAGGSSSWERCCLGLPTIVVVVAENQRSGAEALAAAGAALSCPDATSGALSLEASGMIRDRASRSRLGDAAARLTDGGGARRVSALIVPEVDNIGQTVEFRSARLDDIEPTFQWQLTPGVRAFARTRALPTRQEHESWFRRRLARQDGAFLVIECAGRACGVLRLDPMAATDDLEISILLDPAVWGQGIGVAAVKTAVHLTPGRSIFKPASSTATKPRIASFAGSGSTHAAIVPRPASSWYRMPAGGTGRLAHEKAGSEPACMPTWRWSSPAAASVAGQPPYVIAELAATTMATSAGRWRIDRRGRRGRRRRRQAADLHGRHHHPRPATRPDFRIKGGAVGGRRCTTCTPRRTRPGSGTRPLFAARARARHRSCFSSPFDETAVDLLESLGRPRLQDRLVRGRRPAADPQGRGDRQADDHLHRHGDAGRDRRGGARGARRRLPRAWCCCTASAAIRRRRRAPTCAPSRDLRERVRRAGRAVRPHAGHRPSRWRRWRWAPALIEKHFTLARADGGADARLLAGAGRAARARVATAERAWEALGRVELRPARQRARQRAVPPLALCRRRHRGRRDAHGRRTSAASGPATASRPSTSTRVLGRAVRRDVDYGTPVSWDALA